jgi:predicted Fe-Mo cluster-binding NifX family protein
MPLDKPFQKSDKTVTFVGEDGQEIEVVSNITPAALKILKKQGYKKQSQRTREQEEAALKKADQLTVGGDTGTGDADDEEEVPDESWNRKEIDEWAAELDPPLDTTGAATKADAVALIQERLEADS